jgi:predicted CXXCH cytochrome family protein
VSCHNPHGTNFKGQLKLSGQEDLCVQCHHM